MLSKSSVERGLIVGLGSIGQRHLRNIRQMYGDIELIVHRHQENKDLVLKLIAIDLPPYLIKRKKLI